MVLEEIWVVYALTDENTVSNVPQTCFLACFVIKSYCVSHLPAYLALSFMRYTICHTHCGHPSGLGYDYIYPIDWLHRAICIFLDFRLLLQDRLTYLLRIHHILRKLSWFTWTCITRNYTEVIFWYNFLYFLFILKNWETFLKLFHFFMLWEIHSD